MVGEINNGGDLVRAAIHTVDPNIPFRAVTATRGKIMRAEPVAALYEQSKVHHVGMHSKLEDQMCGYTGISSDDSPDRMDAMVWAIFDLMLARRACPIVAPISIESANYWRGA